MERNMETIMMGYIGFGLRAQGLGLRPCRGIMERKMEIIIMGYTGLGFKAYDRV